MAEEGPAAPSEPRRVAAWLARLAPWGQPVVGLFLLSGRIAPYLIAALVFLGGLVLLLSGALPETSWRTALLRDALPLPFAEASHLSASLAGLALIVLSRGLALRMAQARLAATAVLLAGAVFALAKGLDWEEAALLVLVAAALFAARKTFYRRGDWRSFRPGAGTLILIGITLGAVTLIGFLGYRNVDYRTELWWSFAWHGDAPRFLRATFALTIAAAALALDALINRPLHAPPRPAPVPDAVRKLLADCPESSRQLALLGDKQFLVSPDEDAFLMYAVSGRSWVCLGGPVGATEAGTALIWDLAERADRVGGRPVFYGVSAARMTQLLDLGHAILKTGELARIDLAAFSLEGSQRKDLRYARSRATRDGLVFGILPRAEVPANIDALRTVSDTWMDSRKGNEKSFSLGRFDPGYLAEFDLAVLRHEGRIVAFANLWRGAHDEEIAIDLMRYLPGISPVMMDALMTETILYGQSQGYRWFNLGAAQLSGLSRHPLAPVWSRIGTLIYRRGDEFYGFEGLRAFKQKFGPVWTPQYLTCPGGMSIPRVLVDVTLLISRPRSRPDDTTPP
ncbi:phosphatidylglycerol lysyltransferase domain-containing protein [Actibacterium sp. D379-3]